MLINAVVEATIKPSPVLRTGVVVSKGDRLAIPELGREGVCTGFHLPGESFDTAKKKTGRGTDDETESHVVFRKNDDEKGPVCL
jgi:hypothetical protein